MEIIYTKYGFANSFPGSHIELNRNLSKYPGLQKRILEHEGEHLKGNHLVDLTDCFSILPFKAVAFMLRHPSSLRDVSPIIRNNKKEWHIDPVLSGVYICLIALFTGGVFL